MSPGIMVRLAAAELRNAVAYWAQGCVSLSSAGLYLVYAVTGGETPSEAGPTVNTWTRGDA